MKKVKALQANYTDVAYVFLSLDRGKEAWRTGIKKYQVEGDHYYMPSGKKCDFADFVNISWIPRYMLINKAGEIVVFNVIEADARKSYPKASLTSYRRCIAMPDDYIIDIFTIISSKPKSL